MKSKLSPELVHMEVAKAMPELKFNEAKKIYNNLAKLFIDQNEIDEFNNEPDYTGIKSPKEWMDGVIDRILGDKQIQGCVLPWIKSHDKIRLRKGELSLWCGYNGHKKTMTLTQVALHLIAQGQTVVIASMEMHPEITLKRMAQQAIANQKPSREFITKFIEWLEGKLFIYDQQNIVSTDRIIKMVDYCGYKLKADHLIIDSLMKCGIAPDDYTRQKNFINELCVTSKDTGMHSHLVCHMRKPQTDKMYMPNRYDISGGSDISNQADNIFICWSDVEKNHERLKPEEYQDKEIMSRPCQKLAIEKQREGEFEGRFTLNFHPRSLQMIEHKPIEYWKDFINE